MSPTFTITTDRLNQGVSRTKMILQQSVQWRSGEHVIPWNCVKLACRLLFLECIFDTFKLCIFDRELAYQIADQFRVFGKHIGLKDAVIVGGIGKFWRQLQVTPPPSISVLSYPDMMKQSLALARKPHVVIATPGRLADHIRSTDTVSLKKIKFLVRPCKSV